MCSVCGGRRAAEASPIRCVGERITATGVPEFREVAWRAYLMFSGSDSALAVAKVADNYKTPILALFASHPDITKFSSFVNQFNFDDTFQASVAALYVRDELLIDKVAIMTQPDNVHFSYLTNKFSEQFIAADGEITDTIYLIENKHDFVNILGEMKKSDPGLLYLPVDIDNLFDIKIALAKLGWNPAIMVSDGIMANVKAQTTYPLHLLDGTLTIDTFAYDRNFTEFGEKVLEQMDLMGFSIEETGTDSALGAEGYGLLIHVMNQCLLPNNNIQVCINDAIRSTIRFEGVKGAFSFDATGKAQRSLMINRVNAGQMEFIVQVY
ncbi:MAG: ABC transporter substrate-binding protein [Methyloprofundus sp.]|nr:ABC transporter substrate-binding protein [Methyloprofundus sp.]